MEPMTLELRVKDGEPRCVFTKGIPSSEELDELIRYLGRFRGNIEPEVPSDLPEGAEVKLSTVDSRGAEVGQELDGSSVLALRHPGFGWLGFRLSSDTRRWLIEALIGDEQRSATQGPTH